jgi:hypothetical protein
MIYFMMDILALIFVLTCLMYSIKLYRILDTRILMWLLLAFGYGAILRISMLLYDVQIITYSYGFISGVFCVMYFLFMLGMCALFKVIKKQLGGKR